MDVHVAGFALELGLSRTRRVDHLVHDHARRPTQKREGPMSDFKTGALNLSYAPPKD